MPSQEFKKTTKSLTNLQKSVRPFVINKLFVAPTNQPLLTDKITKRV